LAISEEDVAEANWLPVREIISGPLSVDITSCTIKFVRDETENAYFLEASGADASPPVACDAARDA
jgi:hypothetical protein